MAEGLEVGAGGKATQPHAQELRACHRDKKRRKKSEQNRYMPVAFADNREVLLCIPMAWDRGCSSP